MLNQLVGFWAMPDSGGGFALTYEDVNTVGVTNNATHTHSSVSFGAAAADRLIAVGIKIQPNGALGTISSVTIGGVGATSIIDSVVGANERVAIFIAAVPTGSTGNVVIVNSTNLLDTEVTVWRLTGASATATDTISDTDTTATVVSDTINVTAGGGVIMIVNQRINDPGSTFTSTLANEDVQAEFCDGQYAASYHETFATAQTGLTVSATASSAGLRIGMVGASFPPV